MKKICAIYTRKSTEEGLDMDFNSLDAQREACESYIKSQKSEGWVASPNRYDDGGFSGGTLERPALKKLLEDIKAGLIHTIVVYKIDRLTRSLFDFAKLVEILDQHDVSFVSITQSFNTTTSMGRLTLNVLLSFAQFEREVTGERIRDKIAASKKKGMWMGAAAPAGYRINGRQLEIVEDEAKTVRYIFEQYNKLKSVKLLKHHLDQKGIKTPKRISKKENEHGGRPFSRGNLYKILGNPAYLGKIAHKGKLHDGLHAGIIAPDVWDETQALLKTNGLDRTDPSGNINMLQGKLFDFEGRPYSPTYTSKAGRQYRYYLSQNLIQHKDHPKGLIARLPAHEIENSVGEAVRSHVRDVLSEAEDHDIYTGYATTLLDNVSCQCLITELVENVFINTESFRITLKSGAKHSFIKQRLEMDLSIGQIKDEIINERYTSSRRRDGALTIQSESKKRDLFDLPPKNLKRFIQGIVWRERHFDGESMTSIAQSENLSEAFIMQTITKAFLYHKGI
jgi:DNA invertase Pin-like site-specific DNA recombinase